MTILIDSENLNKIWWQTSEILKLKETSKEKEAENNNEEFLTESVQGLPLETEDINYVYYSR